MKRSVERRGAWSEGNPPRTSTAQHDGRRRGGEGSGLVGREGRRGEERQGEQSRGPGVEFVVGGDGEGVRAARRDKLHVRQPLDRDRRLPLAHRLAQTKLPVLAPADREHFARRRHHQRVRAPTRHASDVLCPTRAIPSDSRCGWRRDRSGVYLALELLDGSRGSVFGSAKQVPAAVSELPVLVPAPRVHSFLDSRRHHLCPANSQPAHIPSASPHTAVRSLCRDQT